MVVEAPHSESGLRSVTGERALNGREQMTLPRDSLVPVSVDGSSRNAIDSP